MNRLTDNDRNWGPFTIAKWKGRIAFEISSGDDEDPENNILISIFGWALRIHIPKILKPFGKYSEHETKYGFALSKGCSGDDGKWDFFQLFLGPQTHDSDTERSWSKSLPWTQWRHVRTSVYLPDGTHYADEVRGKRNWDAWYKLKQEMPKSYFKLRDYDGKEIVAECIIDEMEWLKGDGWFKWLSWFSTPKIRRSLDMRFDSELGPEKGSWKGGTTGMSTDIKVGETPQQAFERFCQKEIRARGNKKYKVGFIGPCEKPPEKVYVKSSEDDTVEDAAIG